MKNTILLLIIFCMSPLWAESNTSGPDSAVVVGVLKSFSGNHIEVQTKGFLRKLEITDKTKVSYVSFLSVEKKKSAVNQVNKEVRPGYEFSVKSIMKVLNEEENK